MINPSLWLIITAGIVTPKVLFPPKIDGAPGVLFTMITPTAPASCAFNTFDSKEQTPLSITAICPTKVLGAYAAHPKSGFDTYFKFPESAVIYISAPNKAGA